MVGINPKFTQYQVQPKKVAAQEDGDKPQQTQQAETQAVKQPAVQPLQESPVKVPLENLQLNAGITVGGLTNTSKEKSAHYTFQSIEDFKAHRDLLKPGDFLTIRLSDNPKDSLRLKVDKDGNLVTVTSKESNKAFGEMMQG